LPLLASAGRLYRLVTAFCRTCLFVWELSKVIKQTS